MDRIEQLTQIVEQNPAEPFARYGLAMALAAAGRSDDALAEYEKLIAQSPDYVPAYQMSAQALLKAGNTAAASSRLTAGLAACERTGNAHAASEMQAMLDEIN